MFYYIKLYYIRFLIYRAKHPNDLIYILKKFSYNLNTDQIMDFIINCFKIYPLKEYELQKLSNWQQYYDLKTGIENYVTLLFWLCSIVYIQENEKKILLIKNEIEIN